MQFTMKLSLLVLFGTLVAVSAKPAKKAPPPKEALAEFCTGLVDGEIVNDNATLDGVFSDMTTECQSLLDVIEDYDLGMGPKEAQLAYMTDRKKGGGKGGKKATAIQKLLGACRAVDMMDVDDIPDDVLNSTGKAALEDVLDNMEDTCDDAEDLSGASYKIAIESLKGLEKLCEDLDDESVEDDSEFTDVLADMQTNCDTYLAFWETNEPSDKRRRRGVDRKKGGKKGKMTSEQKILATCDLIEWSDIDDRAGDVFTGTPLTEFETIVDDFQTTCEDAEEARDAQKATDMLEKLAEFCDDLEDGDIEVTDTRFDGVEADVVAHCNDLTALLTDKRRKREVSRKKGGGKKGKKTTAEQMLIETCIMVDNLVVEDIPDDVLDTADKASLQTILDDWSVTCDDIKDIGMAIGKLDKIEAFCQGLLDGKVKNKDSAYDTVFADMAAPCTDYVAFLNPGAVSVVDRKKGGGKKGPKGEELFASTCETIDCTDVDEIPTVVLDTAQKATLTPILADFDAVCDDFDAV